MEDYGGYCQARTLVQAAEILEWAQMVWDNEPLTLTQAAEESRFSYSAIQKMVASGESENVGGKGNPRVRRGDLPKKAKQPRRSHGPEGPDLVGDLFLRNLSE